MSFTVIFDHCLLIWEYLKNMASMVFDFVSDVVSFPYIDLTDINHPSFEYVSVTVLELMFGASVIAIITLSMAKFVVKWF